MGYDLNRLVKTLGGLKSHTAIVTILLRRSTKVWGALVLFSSQMLVSCRHTENSPSGIEVLAGVDTLDLLFEVGEELGDSSNSFWSIASADIDDLGRIFVLDDVEACVKVFDSTGAYIQNLTRRGSGPGELLRPSYLNIAPDGRIVISDITKGGFIVFNDSFELEDEVLLWGNNSPYCFAALTKSKYLVCRYSETQLTDGYVLKHTADIYDFSSAENPINLYTDSIIENEHGSGLSYSRELVFVLFKGINSWCNDSGNVFIATLDTLDYQVYGWDSLGNQFLFISLPISPVGKEPDEIDAEAFFMQTYYQRAGGWPPWEPSPYGHRFMTAELGIGPDQNLWVRRGTRTDLFFDIFDLNGNLVRHAVYGLQSWSWKTVITTHGVLAWELDPLEGYQKLYFLR
jgi:hypothetical protein